MSDQPKARFTMPPGVRDVTAAALGTLFAFLGAGSRAGADNAPGSTEPRPCVPAGRGPRDTPRSSKRIDGLASADSAVLS